MILYDQLDEAKWHSLKIDRPAKLCDVCHESLGTEPFAYEFCIEELGSMYGEVCVACLAKYEDDDDLAMALLDEEQHFIQMRISVIDALLEAMS